jgi:hypothetical protein
MLSTLRAMLGTLADGYDSVGMSRHCLPHQCIAEVVSPQDRTSALVRGFAVLLRHHGASDEILGEFERQLHAYLDSSENERIWLKRSKYALAFPLSKYLRNELPPPPDVVFRPSGKLRGWMKPRFNAFNRKNTHLWYSWLQIKRASLPASETFVDETYQEHFIALSSEDNGDADVIRRIFEDRTFEELLISLRRRITDLFTQAAPFECTSPSSSACFESTRSQHGQAGHLIRESGLAIYRSKWYKSTGTCPTEVERYIAEGVANGASWTDEEIDRMKLDGVEEVTILPSFGTRTPERSLLLSMTLYAIIEGKERLFNRVVETREPEGRVEWEIYHSSAQTFELPDLEDEFCHGQSVSIGNTKMLKGAPLCATIQAVLEPFKVRVISKGEAQPYYAMKRLQRAIHTSMRNLSCFRPIGRPISPTDLIDLDIRARADDEWFSVDYSAATDGLSYKYSGRILDFLIADLDERTRHIAREVLGPHELWYPTRELESAVQCECGKWQEEYRTGKPKFRGLQRNGQLMGSILSFPILCLANLGVYLLVNQESQRWWSGRDRLRHVLVNGDDMLYRAHPSIWEKHVEIGKAVGLKMSVGKAYHHGVYANINSTSYHKKVGDTPWKIGYLNCGLYFGQHKIQGDERSLDRDQDKVDPRLECQWADQERVKQELAKAHLGQDPSSGLVVNLNCLLEGSLPGKQKDLLGSFLREHGEAIARETTVLVQEKNQKSLRTRNIFLPKSLGGMGVVPPPGWKFKITGTQKWIATHFLENSSALRTYQLPLPPPGFDVQTIEEPKSPWKVRSKGEEFPSLDLHLTSKRKQRGLGSMLSGIFYYACNRSTFRRQ